MDQSSNKTPVSLLQEICTRKSITPKYDLLQVEGAVHEPIFQYRLTVDFNNSVLEETGSGRSKRDAKHNTALAMLVAMEVLPRDGLPNRIAAAVTGGNEAPLELDISGNDGDLAGNPVGLLQELCMKMKFPPPTYEVHSEEGLPHERIFALACRVGEQYEEVGRGKSKKLAKRQAAHLMAERLRSIPSETSNVHAFDDDDDKILEGLAALQVSKDQPHKKTPLATKGDVENIAKLYQSYQDMALKKMPMLKTPDFTVEDPVKFLENLEDGGTFKAVYIDFDELSSREKFQCCVQVTCDPPIVSVGEGLTRDEAKVNAAKDAIHIFRYLILGT